MSALGVIACGHELTADAATRILQAGGNAFDAIVAAHFAACVAEPVLASLGGGGYLLARPVQAEATVYDFFVQTPHRRRPDTDFYPITADFGTDQQVFHIGAGAIATPGSVRGMFTIHRELCSLPMEQLIEPAVAYARAGVVINELQAYILDIVHPIFTAVAETRACFSSPGAPGKLVKTGEVLKLPELAETLETLAREGDDWFYKGQLASEILALCQHHGGLLQATDLEDYQVIKRPPLSIDYRGARIMTNPPPSSGGILIAFALGLLEHTGPLSTPPGSEATLGRLIAVMDASNRARRERHLDQPIHLHEELTLDPDYLHRYQVEVLNHPLCRRGTTHMSIMDIHGNIASMTVSNGEGCGRMLGSSGIMLNNMLGEEDLNPHGFQRWPLNQRMTSMMAPSLVTLADGRQIALGSGGSNRIRTAILQVLSNLIDHHMPLDAAVNSPRIHYEGPCLSMENGFADAVIDTLADGVPKLRRWPVQNLFFGGVHSVVREKDRFTGCGDPRRGGVTKIVFPV